MTRLAPDTAIPQGQPDYVAQVATVPFLLGRPEELPTTVPGIERIADRAARVRGRLSGPGSRESVGALLAAARAVRDELVPTGDGRVGDDPEESEANRDNDLAFGIVRTRGPAAALLVDAAVAALIGVLEVAEAQGSDLEPQSWQWFLDGFDALLGWFAEPGSVPVPAAVPAAGTPTAAVVPQDALRRWVRGHHVFMVFAQAATMACHVLQDGARRTDPETAATAAGVLLQLMRGCQGALAYAGSANRAQYNEQIRPTLTPPVAPPKMSGLHWRDHEALIVALGSSGPAWSWLESHRPGLLGQFRNVLGEAYDAHRGVCGHFVGDTAPSLLATQRSSRSAVGVLSQLRRVRLGALPEPTETSPGTSATEPAANGEHA
ncbi:hypothetical protein P8605_37060 [Streptomyces sp. T-3]|nr:hypothetical protein [Streptomyces sp. T-3]